MKTLLSIDADWVMNPTPRQLVPGMYPKPCRTAEAAVYDYGSERGLRPRTERHEIALPAQSVADHLHVAGLPRGLSVQRTEIHGEIRDIWTPDVLADVDRLVILDAHVDIYPVISLRLEDHPTDRLIHATVYELISGKLDHLLGGKQVAQSLAWDQAWLLLALPLARSLEIIDWVVPCHFEAALDQGFPYPEAQWFQTLKVGQGRHIWSYSLNKHERRITLHIVQPSRHKRRKVTIRVRLLHEIEGLASVQPPIHLCNSPTHASEPVDQWGDELEQILLEDRTDDRSPVCQY